MNDRNFFNVLGALISAIAAVFDSIGLTPFLRNCETKPIDLVFCEVTFA